MSPGTPARRPDPVTRNCPDRLVSRTVSRDLVDAEHRLRGALAEGDAVERLTKMDHVHLPKLEEYGFIDWDRDTHEVRKGPNFDDIRPLLEPLQDHEDELPPGWL